jgi:hypothetical protein
VRARRLLVIAAAGAALAGCAEERTVTPPLERSKTVNGPFLFDFAGLRKQLGADGIRVRADGAAPIPDLLIPRPRGARRYTTQGGTVFDVFLYRSGDPANDAADSVNSRGTSYVVVGQNVVGLFRKRKADAGEVGRTISGLGGA